MYEERKSFRRAMEDEHQKIITTKMKLAVHKKLHPEVVDIANGEKDAVLHTSENILIQEMNKQCSTLNLQNGKVLQVRYEYQLVFI